MSCGAKVFSRITSHVTDTAVYDNNEHTESDGSELRRIFGRKDRKEDGENSITRSLLNCTLRQIRGLFEKFVDWRQYAAVVLREAVTVMPSCSGGGNIVVT
jgi:hypothetical protein